MMAIYESSETLKAINPALENYYEYDTLDPKSKTARDYERALKEASQLTSGRKLLEVGCGAGSFLEFAREKGWEVSGVDSSEKNNLLLKEKKIRGICSGYLDAPENERFDVIVLWDLIEHPQNPNAFTEKSFRLLNPGGVLILATPCYPNLMSVLAHFFYILSFGNITSPLSKLYMLEHTSYFRPDTLKNMVISHGFKPAADFKTETDLKRYLFSKPLRLVLVLIFLAAQLIYLQNRYVLLAERPK